MRLSRAWISIEHYVSMLVYKIQGFQLGEQVPDTFRQFCPVQLFQILYLCETGCPYSCLLSSHKPSLVLSLEEGM